MNDSQEYTVYLLKNTNLEKEDWKTSFEKIIHDLIIRGNIHSVNFRKGGMDISQRVYTERTIAGRLGRSNKTLC